MKQEKETEPSEITGILNLEKQQTGTEIYLDGEHQGLAPMKITDLPPGDYDVTIEFEDGYKEIEVTIPESGEEVIVPEVEPEHPIETIAGDESSFEECCGGDPSVEAVIETRDPTYVYELITIHTLRSGENSVPYTLYLDGEAYYQGKLVRSEETYTREGCDTCYEMEDHIRLTLPPGEYILKVEDDQLCAASDGKGRLVFLGSEGTGTYI